MPTLSRTPGAIKEESSSERVSRVKVFMIITKTSKSWMPQGSFCLRVLCMKMPCAQELLTPYTPHAPSGFMPQLFGASRVIAQGEDLTPM